MTTKYTPTGYGTFKTVEGQEFINNEAGEYVEVILQNQAQNQNGVPPGQSQQSVINVSAGIGTLEEFKSNCDWSIYSERLEQYFNANYVDEARKVSVLITVIGPEVYKTLRDLCDPVLPQNKTYAELCEILRKHFSPQISVFKERRIFYELKQQVNETISQWCARVKERCRTL